MISIDTETTGLDLYHGARPFFVTTCDEEGEQRYYEWDVDPLTREVDIPPEDVAQIDGLISSADWLVLQNAKFDVGMLGAIGIDGWPWWRTYDTLLAGHILASNKPHDLTSMAIQYLGVDITPFEKALEEAVKECRRAIQQARLKIKRGKEGSDIANWRIAEKGLEEMPSAKETTWKYDSWLPRTLVKYKWETSNAGLTFNAPWLLGPGGEWAYMQKIRKMEGWEYRPPEVEDGKHPWWTVLADYANADSSVTLALWKVQRRDIEAKDLWDIYMERVKCLRVAYGMESRGISVSRERIEALTCDYLEESSRLGRVCVNIADNMGYYLDLPKSGNNKSLIQFCFGIPKENDHPLFPSKAKFLDLPIVERTDTGNPSLAKSALDQYMVVLPDRSKAKKFVECLKNKRARDTAITYMESYRRFWLPIADRMGRDPEPGDEVEWFVLHPSLNMTGTDTLRWSCSNPNEQNISKREGFNLRYCFGPAPGREWWSLDAKNIEARLPAYESGEQDLIGLYERPNEPPYYGSGHLLNFHTVYPEIWNAELKEVGIEKVGPHCKKKYAATWYQWVKNGGFAVQYGAMDRADGMGTADRAFHKPGAHALLKSRFSKLEKLNQKCIQHAEKYGYVETMPDLMVNPRRGYPLLCTRTEYGRILPTVPLNYHIQGTAMWWMLKAMIRCQDKLDDWNRRAGKQDYFLIMQVHDELVFDFPKSMVPPAPGALDELKQTNLWRVKVLQGLMEQGGEDIGIPTPVSIEYHPNNWSEGVTL